MQLLQNALFQSNDSKCTKLQFHFQALQNSLRQGFLALNQFQHSGFRTKVVSDIEKELSPLKIKKRKMQRLSKKCFEESTAICERNTAILNKQMEREQLTPICERVPPISKPITIPTAEPVRSSLPANTQKTGGTTTKPTLRLNKLNTSSLDWTLSDDDYDEGGFTPRPQPIYHNDLNKLPKIPSIAKEPSIFITAPDDEV